MPEEAKLIHAARKVNDAKPEWVVDKVKIAVADYLQANPNKTAKDVTIACYGLAFKANIDDLRESPALKIVLDVSKIHSGPLVAVEPNIAKLPKSLSNIKLMASGEVLGHAQIHVLLVDHLEFKEEQLFSGLEYVIDTRGLIRDE
jgi:UDP-N-acetyl-D-mannosaminuronic acid dehydrogenase